MFLYYAPELVKALLRPIFAFSGLPVWCFDFAPHDVGRYPYATGQIYGLLQHNRELEFTEDAEMIYPFYAAYPDGRRVYDFRTQMPVEESGNLLIMTAAVCCMEKNADFAVPHLPLLEKWVNYLIQYGKDPGEQLCTDDFAGHLNHNINLSAKAIMGIEAWAQIHRLMGNEEEYQKYHHTAKEYAAYWEENAVEEDHTLLAYGRPESWSLKYNTVWDWLFGSGLWEEEIYEQESAYYREKCGTYGVPLDNREDYGKSDWMMWAAAMDMTGQNIEKFSGCILKFLEESPDRVPFSDWYRMETGRQQGFQNRTVQGGIFMPILLRRGRMADSLKCRESKKGARHGNT